MNHLAIAGLLIFFTSFFSSAIVLLKGPKRNTSITWALFSISVTLWGLGLFKAFTTDVEATALFWTRLLNLTAIFIPLFFFHFVLCFTESLNIKRKELISYYLGSIFYFLVIIKYPNLFIPRVGPVLSFNYYPKPGPLYFFFGICYAFSTFYSVRLLFKKLKISKGAIRNQVKYLLLGVVSGFIGGGMTFLPVYGILIYPIGVYLVNIYVLGVTYAILRYRLMDINLVITRAGIFAFVYVFVLGIPFLIVRLAKPYLVGAFSDKWWLVILVVGMVLSGMGPLIYMKLQRRAEAVLLRQERERHEALAKASRDILRFNRLDSLTRAIVHSLVRIMQIKLAAIYLADEEKNTFKLKTAWQPPLKNPDLPQEFAFDSLLVKELYKEKSRTLNLDEVRFRSQSRSALETFELKQVFERLSSQLIIPAVRADKLMGFLALGEKRSERGYSQEDIEVLMVLANHATLAIENAIFNEDERERQAIMFHSASLASLGTMASMMGHQVNNRFQAVNNLAGSAETLEILLASSSGFSEDDWKRLAQQAITSLRRISEEATKGGEIVASIRRLGKLSSEEFKPLTVKEVLDIALGILKYKIKFEEFEFITQVPETLPKIMGDATQLGEVFFNLIDNAYDAIRERKQSSNDPGYKPQIHINAHIKNDARYVFIEVKDTGIGVKEEFKSKLFIPFYTTKASSGKGTGLGLHVIKRIIEFHQGKISVESKYGEGTTFKIELPAAVEKT